MDSKTYWAEREAEQLKYNVTDEREYERQITQIYQDMLDNIRREIEGFYGRYADKEGISIAQAKKKVSQLDMDAYERKAKKYVKEKDFSDLANEEMRLYNLTMKVNRLELLKANIGLEMVSGFDGLQKYFDGILTNRTLAEFSRQAGILGKSVFNNAKAANAIVNASFHNARFSDRIWMYQDLLKHDLEKLLKTGLIQGKHPRELSRQLVQRFGVSSYNALRLMRTELARVQTDAQKLSFDRNGYDRYTFIAENGPKTCDICRGLNGKVFEVKKMMSGDNAAPMHAGCRCSAAAYMDREEFDKWLDEQAKLNRTMPMDLQTFAESNKASVLRKIQDGLIDEVEFDRCYQYFKNSFDGGVKTPVSRVYDTKDRFYHIVDRHQEMMTTGNVDRVVDTLKKPSVIYKTTDKFGIKATCYIEKGSKKPLIVIDRGGIITAYEPGANYLKKIKEGELLWPLN